MAQVVGTVVYGLNAAGQAKPILVDADGIIQLDDDGNFQAAVTADNLPMVGVLLCGIDSSGVVRAVKVA